MTSCEPALLPFAPSWSLEVADDGFALLVPEGGDNEAIWASEDIAGRIGWLQADSASPGRMQVRRADVEATDWELFDLRVQVGDIRAEVPFTVEVKALHMWVWSSWGGGVGFPIGVLVCIRSCGHRIVRLPSSAHPCRTRVAQRRVVVRGQGWPPEGGASLSVVVVALSLDVGSLANDRRLLVELGVGRSWCCSW